MGRTAGNPHKRERDERDVRAVIRKHLADALAAAKNGDPDADPRVVREKVGRDEVAARLGISGKTIDTYTRPSHPVAPSSVLLYRMLVGDVLPAHARIGLLRAIAFDADCAVVELPDPDAQGGTALALCDLAKETGDAADAVRTAISPIGIDGRDISEDEAKAIVKQARKIIEKAVELIQVTEREAGV